MRVAMVVFLYSIMLELAWIADDLSQVKHVLQNMPH